MIKKTLTASTLIAMALAFSYQANAAEGDSSLSVGWATSHIDANMPDLGNPEKNWTGNANGFNAKFAHVFYRDYGLMTSLTYTKKDMKGLYGGEANGKMQYLSLAAGPYWQIGKNLGAYFMLGMGYGKTQFRGNGFYSDVHTSDSTIKPVGGLGVQYYPTKNLVIDAGVEFASLEFDHDVVGYKAKINTVDVTTFVLGVGYHF